VTIVPSVSGRAKSGALVPSGSIVDGVSDMMIDDNRRSKIKDQRSKIKDRRLEIEDWRSKIGDWRTEIADQP